MSKLKVLVGVFWLELKKSPVAVLGALLLPLLSIPAFHTLKERYIDKSALSTAFSAGGPANTSLFFKSALLHIPGFAFLCFIGMITFLYIISKMRSEMRGGQLRLLKMTPVSGYAHLTGRLLFLFTVSAIFLGEIFSYGTFEMTKSFQTIQATVESPFRFGGLTYLSFLFALILPFLSWMLLLITVMSAYSLKGSPGLVGLFTCFASFPFFMHFLDYLNSLGGKLIPKIQPTKILYQGQDIMTDSILISFEPTIGMIVLSIFAILLAGRIWEEMEL